MAGEGAQQERRVGGVRAEALNFMIFDSEQANSLAKRYVREPDYCVPQSVLMLRSEALEGERQLIERIVASTPKRKHNDWKSRLLSKDDPQHLGAWFEVRLLEWLQKHGSVEVEPLTIADERPDFAATVQGLRIVLEAVAYTKSSEDRKLDCWEGIVWAAIDTIERPYVLNLDYEVLTGDIDTVDLRDAVMGWLDSAPDEEMIFEDGKGNRIHFVAERRDLLKRVLLVASSSWKTAKPMHRSLGKKAGQHAETRESGVPYVIAVFLEPLTHSARNVAETWFGRVSEIYDFEKREIVGSRLDGSGLYFLGSDIRHRTVAGTLVFQRLYSDGARSFSLVARYVENPYAIAPIGRDTFKVAARYVVSERSATGFQMSWEQFSDSETGIFLRDIRKNCLTFHYA